MLRKGRYMVGALVIALWVAMPVLGMASPRLNEPLDLGASESDPARHYIIPNQKTEADAATPAPLTVANPLWAVTLESLSATRERPLFTPSRRPPAPRVASIPANPASSPPPTVEHPNLRLVGTVHRSGISIAVFTEELTNEPVRLRPGEGHMGWILKSVERHSATLQKGAQTERLDLPISPVAELQAAPTPAATPGPVTWDLRARNAAMLGGEALTPTLRPEVRP
jgi:general secretion pathway protein N